jgi:hypothetical protein
LPGWLVPVLGVFGFEEAGEGVDCLEQQGVDALLLVGSVAGAELGDCAAMLGLGSELTDAGGHGRADGSGRPRPG